MENITIVTSEIDGSEHIIIDNGNGQLTGMSKSTYDEMIANQPAPLEGEI